MKKSFVLTLLTLLALCGQTATAQDYPFQDPNLTPEQRAEDLLHRLTLEEKASLMQHAAPAIPRLGINPYNWWNEALHGVARNGTATVFPQTIAMAATFDDKLVHRVFDAVSDEARAKNRQARQGGQYKIYQGLTFWTPNINIFRDPRWGRGQETYGEDPYLTSMMGLAAIQGLQGPSRYSVDKLHACAKHFAVHSGPEWNRHTFDVEMLSPRDLYETYLPAFKTAVQRGRVKEVMCAYNRFDGEPCCSNGRLLTQILRNEWGFTGIVTSDCWAIADLYERGHHETYDTQNEAVSAAIVNGTDIECGSAFETIPSAVAQGLISEESIDIALRRLLKARFELGIMDKTSPWDEIPLSIVNCDAHRELNLQTAREGVVLLQNNRNILPLRPNMTIAVVGPNAADSIMMRGNYNGTPTHTTTLLEGIRKYVPEARIIYESGCDHVSETRFVSAFPQAQSELGAGVTATYWNNRTREGEPAARVLEDSPISKSTYGATTFAQGVSSQDFCATYTTTLRPAAAQDIDFHILSFGTFRMMVNGEEVAQSTKRIRAPKTVHTIHAEAGKSYDIVIEYTPEANNANFSLDFGTDLPTDIDGMVKRVRSADVVIFAGGISPRLEGEEMPVNIDGFKGGDRTDIQLPRIQRRAIEALRKAGCRVVFVNFSGSAIGMEPERRNADAIVQAFYPGAEGGLAIADVLFGTYNPAGRLPITFYKDTLQLPDFLDYSMRTRTYRYMKDEPSFAFGYGLSYTTFAYGKAAIKGNRLVIPVTNTGRRDGDEVVQLYVSRPDDAEGPQRTLRAFQRVSIPKGKTCDVEFELTQDTFEWWDAERNTMHPRAGEYTLLYGPSSRLSDLHAVTYRYNR